MAKKLGIGCGALLAIIVVLGVIGSLGNSGGNTEPKASSAETAQSTAPAAAPAESPPSQTPSEEPAAPEIKIGNGTHRVGTDVQPGIYVAEDIRGSCYWERLSGLGGTFEEIIANDNVSGHAVVEIVEGDAAFQSRGCGDWVPADTATSRDPSSPFGDGTWRVGADIAPGTWQSSSEGSCYWARLSGFGGTLDQIIANENVEGRAIVQIADGDAGFESRGCGEWSRTTE